MPRAVAARTPEAPGAPRDPRAARAPSPNVALLLSLLSPCVGHVYVGRARRGAAWIVAWLLAEVPLTALLLRASPRLALVGLVAAGVAIWLGAAVDAFVIARRATVRAPWRLVAVTSMALFAVERLETLAFTSWLLESVVTPSAAMSPTLLIGDHVLIDKSRAGRAAPTPGDVVVLRSPERPAERYVYRVIATAGQRVELKDGRIELDGAPIPRCLVGPATLHDPTMTGDAAEASRLEGEIYVERLGARAYLTLVSAAASASRDGRTRVPTYVRANAGPWTVKPGEVFVLGDDRDAARDSRAWFGEGAGLPLGNVEGRAFAVFYEDTAEALRFDRTGADPGGRPRLPKELAALRPALERCLAPDAPLER